MKKIITIITITALVLGLGAISFAQDAGPQGGKIQARAHGKGMGGGLKVLEKIQKDVLAGMHLSDDQMKKISDLNKSTEDKLKDLRKENKGSKDKSAMNDKRKDLMKNYNESIRGILTGDQFKTYHEQMKAKMKEFREEHKKDSNGKP